MQKQPPDIRTTQEIFGDLFGGLASLGVRGADGFVIAKALARLLIQQGIVKQDAIRVDIAILDINAVIPE